MFNYGRKIIKYFFAKWTESNRLCYEYLPRIQADSHRSDIRVFETRISTQRYGDNLESTSDLADTISLCLINTAKENNLFVPQEKWDSFENILFITFYFPTHNTHLKEFRKTFTK